MKKGFLFLCSILLLTLSSCGGAEENVAATFRGEPIFRENVEAYYVTAAEEVTDRDIVDHIVRKMILMEEAEARGVPVTEEDVEQFVKDTVYASYEMPEGKADIDEYCRSLGVTFEEYVEIVRDQCPLTIARAKVQESVAREYCEANGLTFDPMNPINELYQVLEDYEAGLWDENKKNIKYYVD